MRLLGNDKWRRHVGLVDMRTNKHVEAIIGAPSDGSDVYFHIKGAVKVEAWQLRDAINLPFIIPIPEGGHRKLDSFTEGQIKALYPFALVLACLDGNAFVNHEDQSCDLVRQYIPEVFATLASNHCVELSEDGATFRSDFP